MKTIYLQRQGSSYTFNTNNAINSHWGYYVEVETLPGNRYAIRISHTVQETDGKNKTKTINIDARFPSLSDAFRRIEQEFREEYGEDIRIADTIEMYCHNNFTYRKTDDRYLVSCFYEKSTETIRLYPGELLPRIVPAQGYERLSSDGRRDRPLLAHIGETGRAARKGMGLGVPCRQVGGLSPRAFRMAYRRSNQRAGQ